ncbi:MAG: arginine synthesis PII-interacting regulator PirA [Microcystaceae cyanobacterium]
MERNQQQRLQNATQAHRASMLKSLEHRLEVAKAKGDEILTRQLEAEKSNYHF